MIPFIGARQIINNTDTSNLAETSVESFLYVSIGYAILIVLTTVITNMWLYKITRR